MGPCGCTFSCKVIVDISQVITTSVKNAICRQCHNILISNRKLKCLASLQMLGRSHQPHETATLKVGKTLTKLHSRLPENASERTTSARSCVLYSASCRNCTSIARKAQKGKFRFHKQAIWLTVLALKPPSSPP